MTQQFSDRQIQVIKIALETLRTLKQDQCINVTPKQPLNEFDILQPEHTLMESLALLARLTGHPVSYFTNPHPSQSKSTGGTGKPPLAEPSHEGIEKTAEESTAPSTGAGTSAPSGAN